METYTTEEFNDQLFISNTAWVFIVLSSVILYASSVNLWLFQGMISVQNKLFEGFSSPEITQKFEVMQNISLTGLSILLVSSVLLLVSAILVLKRKNYGRILFTISCIAFATLAILLMFYLRNEYMNAHASLGENINLEGFFSSSFGGLMAWKMKFNGVFLIITAWALVRVLVKLNRKQIRQYFR